MSIAELAYADDFALPGANAETTTSRLTNLDTHVKILSGMVICVPKTKAQHIMIQPKMSETTENDMTDLPPEKQLKLVCDKCGRTFPTNHGFSVHKGWWCKGRRRTKQPNRKGSVADHIIQK